MVVCGECGAKVPPSRFCPNCGKALRLASSTSGALADRRVVSVMFAEVVGLSGAGGGSDDPETQKATIDDCLKAISAPVFRYGGIVDKYIGGSVVMALFGAPVSHEDDPERAVRAAWDMRREVERFGRERGLGLEIRVGINTGLVVAGAVGGTEKRDYTVMGDAVNLAQRLEANAATGEIWVGEETYRRARGAFVFRALDPIRVKGKEAPVATYAVLAPHERPEPDPPPPRLVGRTLELQRLGQHVQAAIAGGPQACFVRGDAGSGKSALLSSLDLSRFRVWRAQCRSFDEPTPYALVRDLLRDMGTPPDEASLGEEDAEVLAWVIQGGGAPARSSALAGLKVDQLQGRAADVLADVFLARRPVALVLEDLQWLDDASRIWLVRLIERFRSPESKTWEVFLALSTRPGGWLPDLAVTTFDLVSLYLTPLQAERALELAGDRLGLAGPPGRWPAAVRNVLARAAHLAQGNPRFVVELVGNLVDSGLLYEGAGHWIAGSGATAVSLPTTIQAAIRSRLDRLGAVARAALRAAAVLGREVSPALVRDMVGEAASVAGIEELVSAGILAGQGDTLHFRQDLVREAAYEALLHRTRRTLHGAAARSLAMQLDTAPDAVEADRLARDRAPILAWHLVGAEEWADSCRYLWLAAERSRQASDQSGALTWLDLCLKALAHAPDAPDAPHPSEVWRVLGEIRTAAGDRAAAREALAKALEFAEDPLAVSAARLACADAAEREGDYDGATAHLAAALELPREHRKSRAKALAKLALIRFRTGEFAGCEDLLDKAQDEADGDADVLGFVHSLRGLCLYRKGEQAEAITCHERSLAFRRHAGDLAGVARSLNNLAVARMEAGDEAGSLADSQEALDVARRIGDRLLVSIVLINLGHRELRPGQAARAADHMRVALDLKNRLNDPVGAATCRVTLGEALVAQGLGDEGVAALREGVAALEGLGAREVLAEAYLALGRACIQAGRREEALEYLEHARDHARQVGATAREQEVRELLAGLR